LLRGVAPPVQETTSTLPSLYATIVPWPCRNGVTLRPLRKNPPWLSRDKKPLLNVERSLQRCPWGTSIGPLGLAFGGSYLPGYRASCVRVWSNQATYATMRGYAASERNVVTRTGGAPSTIRPVDLQIPSPGRRGRKRGADRVRPKETATGLAGAHGCSPDGRKRSQRGTSLLRRGPAVVEPLCLVDEECAVVGSEPLDATDSQRKARRARHGRHVRVEDGGEQDENDDERPASADAAFASPAQRNPALLSCYSEESGAVRIRRSL